LSLNLVLFVETIIVCHWEIDFQIQTGSNANTLKRAEPYLNFVDLPVGSLQY